MLIAFVESFQSLWQGFVAGALALIAAFMAQLGL